MNVIKIFMERDGLSKKEAVAYYRELRQEIYECVQEGGTYNEVEEILLSEGLEMDYIMDFI